MTTTDPILYAPAALGGILGLIDGLRRGWLALPVLVVLGIAHVWLPPNYRPEVTHSVPASDLAALTFFPIALLAYVLLNLAGRFVLWMLHMSKLREVDDLAAQNDDRTP
jgi:hypothetical protein